MSYSIRAGSDDSDESAIDVTVGRDAAPETVGSLQIYGEGHHGALVITVPGRFVQGPRFTETVFLEGRFPGGDLEPELDGSLPAAGSEVVDRDVVPPQDGHPMV
jgi:hypothetical protein